MSRFKKATREKLKLRMAIDGPAKGGKTYTATRLAFALARALGQGRVAVIDTENRSASKYQGENVDGYPWDFDVVELTSFSPTEYTSLIREAEREYDVLVIDSLSHAWVGEGGALDLKDKQASQAGFNSFTAWSKITPIQRQMMDAIIRCQCHVFATMRTKTEYVMTEVIDERTGKKKTVPQRIGMAPLQRDGMEYEFDIYASIDSDHVLTVSGSRCKAIDKAMVAKPGPDFLAPVIEWLDSGIVPMKPKMATEEQLNRIDALTGQLRLSKAQIISGLREKYNINGYSEDQVSEAYHQLKEADADGLEAKLKAAVQRQSEKAAATTVAAPASPLEANGNGS